MARPNERVAEMQGLYGPFTLAERVVQRIWREGDFDRRRPELTDGRGLAIRSPGAWNLLGGPDFRNARLLIDGREANGDVEVHFHVADWRAHGHGRDEAYDNVILHVVLYPPGPDEIAVRRTDGREIPTLVLLPLLHRDLEEYASDEALEVITSRDEWHHLEALAAMPPVQLHRRLQRVARARWRQKVRFARVRIGKLGWSAAAHHTALEILGYRRNRAGMLALAARYPLEDWVAGLDHHTAYADESAHWTVNGVRPANHPQVRLRQYQAWVAACPDWPDQLAARLSGLLAHASAATPGRTARQVLGLARVKKLLADELLGGAVGGSRLDNLVCDGLLPLVAAEGTGEGFGLWFHWFLGDIPEFVRRALPRLGLTDGRLQPLCHGYAQGVLGWLLEREGMQVAD